MKKKHSFFRRGISLGLAMLLTLSSGISAITVNAEETETKTVKVAAESVEHATIKLNDSENQEINVSPGTEVKIDVEAEDGYQIDEVQAEDSEGYKSKVTQNDSSYYVTADTDLTIKVTVSDLQVVKPGSDDLDGETSDVDADPVESGTGREAPYDAKEFSNLLASIKYLNLKGYKACYVQLNNHAWVENMINDYAEVEQDVEIGKATYKSVDMFYRIDKLPEILKLDYDYFIYDYGVYWDVDFNKTSFLEKDLMLFCLGAKPGEFDKSYKVIENNFYQAATYIFIFVPEDEEEKKDIYELMAEKKEATFFAPDCRDPFVYTGSEIYEKILPVESIIEEETPKKKRRLFGRR